MANVTPARRQYLDIKAQYPDCILMFRMGDFYEMFDEDAEVAAQALDITLTTRSHSKKSKPIPMAGVPHHAVDGYIAQLIEKGYHVAVCDQVSEPTGRGIVDREAQAPISSGSVTFFSSSLFVVPQAIKITIIPPTITFIGTENFNCIVSIVRHLAFLRIQTTCLSKTNFFNMYVYVIFFAIVINTLHD